MLQSKTKSFSFKIPGMKHSTILMKAKMWQKSLRVLPCKCEIELGRVYHVFEKIIDLKMKSSFFTNWNSSLNLLSECSNVSAINEPGCSFEKRSCEKYVHKDIKHFCLINQRDW